MRSSVLIAESKAQTAPPQGAGRASVWVAAAVCLLLGTAVHSQTEQISRYSVDAGGGSSRTGAYTLTGTFAQLDAGVASAAGYRLQGGFWSSRAATSDELFANGFE